MNHAKPTHESRTGIEDLKRSIKEEFAIIKNQRELGFPDADTQVDLVNHNLERLRAATTPEQRAAADERAAAALAIYATT